MTASVTALQVERWGTSLEARTAHRPPAPWPAPHLVDVVCAPQPPWHAQAAGRPRRSAGRQGRDGGHRAQGAVRLTGLVQVWPGGHAVRQQQRYHGPSVLRSACSVRCSPSNAKALLPHLRAPLAPTPLTLHHHRHAAAQHGLHHAPPPARAAGTQAELGAQRLVHLVLCGDRPGANTSSASVGSGGWTLRSCGALHATSVLCPQRTHRARRRHSTGHHGTGRCHAMRCGARGGPTPPATHPAPRSSTRRSRGAARAQRAAETSWRACPGAGGGGAGAGQAGGSGGDMAVGFKVMNPREGAGHGTEGAKVWGYERRSRMHCQAWSAAGGGTGRLLAHMLLTKAWL